MDNLLTQIRAEIKRQRADSLHYEGAGIVSGGKIDADDLLSFLDTLEQEPQGLDEAAEEYGKKHTFCPDEWTSTKEIADILACAVKFGASWMAGQKNDPFSPIQPGPGCGSYATTKIGTIDESGFNYEEEVVLDEDGFPCIKSINFHDYDPEKPLFKPGDKVIVQIRKK